jgi:hypothetical protein
MSGILAITAMLAAVAPPAGRRPSEASERARRVLKSAHCDQCHDSSVSSENSRALAVYDLVETHWSARMKDAQLPKLLTRLKQAPEADQKTVRDFVDAERARRASPRP